MDHLFSSITSAETNLSDGILTKLSDNDYTGTESICYILISELKEMEFKLGEIAVMRAATKRWCN